MPLILITGSGRRLGRGLALEFAQKGWDIAVHYNRSEETALKTANEIKKMGVKCITVKADVLSSKEINVAFDKIVNELGHPEVLINNAGVYPQITPLNEISDEMWNDTLGVNLSGEFHFARKFAENAKKDSRIINIASLGGLEIWKQRIPYNVSKAGVIQLTKALARELAPHISVNCICPGTIEIPGEEAAGESPVPVSRIPMERYGSVKDIFDAAYFFATCSNYITAQVLAVDGGFHDAR